jgi:hypothetical protein
MMAGDDCSQPRRWRHDPVEGVGTMRDAICQLAHELDYARALRRQAQLALVMEQAKPNPDQARLAELSQIIEKRQAYLARVKQDHDQALRLLA